MTPYAGAVLVMIRFRVAEPEAFGERVDAALTVLRGGPGFEEADLVQNLDEPDLWALLLRWRDVGSYRRALQGYARRRRSSSAPVGGTRRTVGIRGPGAAVIITLTLEQENATDLGYLLHKNPARPQSFPLSFGAAQRAPPIRG